MTNKKLKSLFIIPYAALAILLLTMISPLPSHGATVESKYYAAERCYQRLRANSAQQKYRDRWLKCIRKFLSVHGDDPRGVWAAAGLYQAGTLYAQLYARSLARRDKQEALKIFNLVIRGYPKSRYQEKSRQARQALLKGSPKRAPTPKSDAARTWYKSGQAGYRRLQANPKLQKYRDKWLKSIQDYYKAYAAEPKGALAAASLYGVARGYDELYDHSFRASDRENARKYYQALIKGFAGSTYAAKAKAALAGESPGSAKAKDGIAAIIKGSQKSKPAAGHGDKKATAQSPAVVKGLRFWSNPGYTRVVIDADRDTEFKTRELREDPSIGKPKRIYIDMYHSRLGKGIQKVMPINDNLLIDARAGQYTQGTVRVVVDIKSFKRFNTFTLNNPFRVVLDVWGRSDDAPRASVPAIAKPKSGKLPPSAIVKQLSLGVKRIVIDPGHGGKDFGAPGYFKGVHEKRVVLQIARRLKRMIRNELKYEVVMTRDKDKYLSLEERTAIANIKKADLFISIHTNAASNKRAYGIATYILNLTTDAEAIRVAARENATSTKNISDLDSILQDLMKNTKVSESTRLANYVQSSVVGRLKKKYKQIKNKGIKQAPFYVLLGADMPSILIETSFISNKRECKRLTSEKYQEQLCRGIVEGIKRYIKDTKGRGRN